MSEFDPALLADGLWRRLRDVILVSERIDTFAFGPDPEDGARRVSLTDADARAISVEFVLRALRSAGDRTNYLILERACTAEGVGADDLANELGVPRLAIAERVADLLQAGLAVRALDSDRVHATPAGEQVAALVRESAARLAATAGRARSPGGVEKP